MSTPFYDADLAWIHHTGYQGVPRAAAAFLHDLLADSRTPPGAVLDLGCGSGVFGASLREYGCPREYIGIDLSPAFLALARESVPGGAFRLASMHRAALPEAAVVTMIGESLNYLPARGRGPDPERLLRRIHRMLPSSGLLLFDVITDGPASSADTVARGYHLTDDWATLASIHPTRTPDVHERRITLFRRVASEWRRSDETHRFRVFDQRALRASLRSLGFTVRTRSGWSDASTLPGRTAFVCRKR